MNESLDKKDLAIQVMHQAWCDSFNACSLGKVDIDGFKRMLQLEGMKVNEFFPKINIESDYRYYACDLELADGFFISKFLLNGLPKIHIKVSEPKQVMGETVFSALFEFKGKYCSLNVCITNMTLN